MNLAKFVGKINGFAQGNRKLSSRRRILVTFYSYFLYFWQLSCHVVTCLPSYKQFYIPILRRLLRGRRLILRLCKESFMRKLKFASSSSSSSSSFFFSSSSSALGPMASPRSDFNALLRIFLMVSRRQSFAGKYVVYQRTEALGGHQPWLAGHTADWHAKLRSLKCPRSSDYQIIIRIILQDFSQLTFTHDSIKKTNY